jgi:DNA-binding CsgD family transcriptional regulator
MGGKILATASGESVISAHRGEPEGPFGESEKAALQKLLPHLKRAALLQGEMESARRQITMYTEHVNRYSHAIFLTDADARVVHASAGARKIAAARDGLRIVDGTLRVSAVTRETAFRRDVKELSKGGNLRRLDVPRPSGQEPYRLLLMPATDCGTFPMGVALPAVSILAVDTANHGEPDEAPLRLLFPFTPAEARVAGKLALGRSPEEIASHLGISVETVRTHLKRALAKTRTTRQGELISLILRSTPVGEP